MPVTFSEHLLQLRTARDLSQKALAVEIGISWRTYQNYELGLREPTLSTLIALADFYGLSLALLPTICWDAATRGAKVIRAAVRRPRGFCSRRGLVQRGCTPHFSFVLPKEKRAVHGPKEKTA
mgnify:CR=1 FL=1